MVNGEAVGAGTHFENTTQVALLHHYNEQAAGLAAAVWLRNGTELVRSEREITGGDGWISFSLMAGGGTALPPGQYEVVLTMPGRPPLRATFTIAGGGVG